MVYPAASVALVQHSLMKVLYYWVALISAAPLNWAVDCAVVAAVVARMVEPWLLAAVVGVVVLVAAVAVVEVVALVAVAFVYFAGVRM